MGGCFDLLNCVIPTGADHRKAMICVVEGPGVATSTGGETHRDRAGMEGTKAITSSGNTLSSRRTAPLKPKPGLSGPLARASSWLMSMLAITKPPQKWQFHSSFFRFLRTHAFLILPLPSKPTEGGRNIRLARLCCPTEKTSSRVVRIFLF